MPASLGGYELIQRIAVGGMAEVFLARRAGPEGFEKRVAVKRILPHLGREPDFVAMFLDEARLAARLDHPHVVHVYDFGVDGSDYFLAMEHVAGQDVQSILRRAAERESPIDFADAATLLIDACEALHHAHEQGVIHRDVTPSNLLVSYDGIVKLADFGIAKMVARATRTETGALKGKLAYMSPEQAGGAVLDRRTDVFSLGVCGWELLAGKRRLDEANELDLLERVRAGEVPRLELARPGVPPELRAVLERALERDPERRWPSARAFGEALAEWLRSTGAVPSSARLAAYMTELFGAAAATEARTLLVLDEPTAPAVPSSALPQGSIGSPADSSGSPQGSSGSPQDSFGSPQGSFGSPRGSSRLPSRAHFLWKIPRVFHLPTALPSFGRLGRILRLPRLRLLVPLAALLLSGSGLLYALRSPHAPLSPPSVAAQPIGVSAPALAPPAPVVRHKRTRGRNQAASRESMIVGTEGGRP
ncbi:MAG TPA: serine/threonine-protein kinase [Polyangia bacterium]|nr:serine/threonine-protein kinase [Polyangia bacterium]